MTPNQLQQLFYQEIPLTQHMGITILTSSPEKVEINFRLKENRNHKGTAFGGSQYTACALSCYGLFLVGIREKGIETNNIVIAEGNMEYSKPIEGDFNAIAEWSKQSQDDFFAKLAKKKKARVTLKASITSGLTKGATFKGEFVAMCT